MRTKSRSTYGLFPAVLLAIFLCVQSLPAQGTKQKAETSAVIAGTVFRDPGFAQGGASVVLALKSSPTKKLQQQITASRGEFSFRVPRRSPDVRRKRYIKGVSDCPRRDSRFKAWSR